MNCIATESVADLRRTCNRRRLQGDCIKIRAPDQPEIQRKECDDKWKSLAACRLKVVCGQKGGHQLPESVGFLGCAPSSRQTGGWVKAAGVVAAGGAQAQSGSKRGMSSCDALLCILSVRAVSIKVARSGANCRVNSCVSLLSEKNFADGRSVRRRVWGRYGLATVVVLSDRIRLLRCRDGPLPPWSCGDGYSFYGGAGSCKGEGAGWALNCVLGKGRRDGHDTVVALAGSVPVSDGIDVRSIFRAFERVDGQARCRSVTREITRECVRLCEKFWAHDGRRVAAHGPRWWPFCGGWRG